MNWRKNPFPIDAPALHTDVFFIVPSRINYSNSKEVNISLFLPSFCKRFSKWIGFLDDRSSLLHFNCVYIRGELFFPSSTFFVALRWRHRNKKWKKKGKEKKKRRRSFERQWMGRALFIGQIYSYALAVMGDLSHDGDCCFDIAQA